MANATYMKLERIPYTLETKRLVLRTYDPRDPAEAPRMYEAIDKNRDHLMRHMSWAKTHDSVEVTRAWIRETRGKFEAMTDFPFGIFTRDDGRFVGGCGLHVRGEPVPCALEIGYWLCENETNKGYAREAAEALTRVALDLARTDRVIIRAAVDNTRSRRVPEALGYTFEGIARKSLRTNDIPTDAAIYAMTS